MNQLKVKQLLNTILIKSQQLIRNRLVRRIFEEKDWEVL